MAFVWPDKILFCYFCSWLGGDAWKRYYLQGCKTRKCCNRALWVSEADRFWNCQKAIAVDRLSIIYHHWDSSLYGAWSRCWKRIQFLGWYMVNGYFIIWTCLRKVSFWWKAWITDSNLQLNNQAELIDNISKVTYW